MKEKMKGGFALGRVRGREIGIEEWFGEGGYRMSTSLVGQFQNGKKDLGARYVKAMEKVSFTMGS
jgi:hypothetical protein